MNKIKVNPVEPRFIVRAIAEPGQDIKNQDFQFLIQIGDEFYDLCPNKIKLKVGMCAKITMDAEIDLHDMIIDMPATVINDDGDSYKARFRLTAQKDHPGQYALNSSSDIQEVTADGEEIFAKSFILEADGETNGNKLTVHTLRPRS